MKKEKWVRVIILILGGILLAFLAFVAVTYMFIFSSVRDKCNEAISDYQKDCVDSLVLVLESETKNYKEKNDAIWALGQIADERALPALEKLQTGNMPEREPLDSTISQYEIEKAIRWINQGNWTSWMYIRFR